MNIDYVPRARANLAHIGAQSRRIFGEVVAAALETHIRETIERLAVVSKRQHLRQRPTVFSLPLVRYPFRLFYELTEDSVVILHIRHTSRRGWVDARN
jgi:plasmid stabilization system protein ParE